jgi:hypoxanthine phosphoribosyltransferase
MFMSDLVRRLTVAHNVDFMSLSSYGNSTVRGAVRIIMDCRQDVGGKDVLIVEDIVDSGYTLQFLQNLFRTRKPASLATAVFLRKPECLKVEVEAEFVGFDVPNKWICGYGLDCREDFRSFPFIGTLKKEIYEANP